jgi:hypothetical protein
MACKTLVTACRDPLHDGYMQITPPVVHSVVPLCKVGNDDTGDKLISLLEKCEPAETLKQSTSKPHEIVTAMQNCFGLPIYKDGSEVSLMQHPTRPFNARSQMKHEECHRGLLDHY